MGADRISGITALRSAAVQLRSGYRGTSQVLSPPSMTVTPTITPGQNTQLALTADCRGLNVKSIDALLHRSDGSTFATVPLYDDGTHGDGQAADGIFMATYSLPQQSSGLFVDASVGYANSTSTVWQGLVNNVTTAGPVLVTSLVIVSDNLNSDRIANPGEDIRIGFTLVNNSTAMLQNLSVTLLSTSNSAFVGTVNASSSVALKYDPTDATTYLSFTAPSATADTIVSLSLLIKDPTGNRWSSVFTLPVKLIKYPVVNQSVTRMSGPDGGDFDISVVDPFKIKNHIYYIYGLDSVNTSKARGYRLLDSNTGGVLIDNHPLPDVLGHTSPVVDGFKVLRGTIDTVEGGLFRVAVTRYAGTAVTPPLDILRKVWSDGLWSFDAAGSTSQSTALIRLNWSGNAKHDYELRITPNDNTTSEYYSISGGLMTGSLKSTCRLPVQIWDVTLNTRLIPGVLQDRFLTDPFATFASSALTNLGANVGWNRIYASSMIPYQEPLPSTAPTDDATKTAILGRMVFVDWRGQGYFPPAGTVIRLSSHHLVSSTDSWSFNPAQILAQSPLPIVPTSFALSQNYPNPFNPLTTIRFELAKSAAVKLRVFNILGQLVATLVNEQKNGGYYQVDWNASGVASGVYFYRLQAGDFVQTKKMVVVK